jgi:hypothetical protein
VNASAFGDYHVRSIRFLELWRWADWKIKLYGICEQAGEADGHFIQIAKSIATTQIWESASGTSNRGAGFLTIHIARSFNQIIFDWWACQNELRHLVFKSLKGKRQLFEDITATGEAFCIWELAVIQHERNSWVSHILRNPSGPDFNAYYKDVLNGYV